MNIYHPTIKTFNDINTWLKDLDEAGMLFDVSLPARSVVSLSTGQRMWTDVEADLIDSAVQRCLDLCAGTNFDLGEMVGARMKIRQINEVAAANWDDPEWRRQQARELADTVYTFPHFDPDGPKRTPAQVYAIVADKDNGAGGSVWSWSRDKGAAESLMAEAVAKDGDEYVLSFVRYDLVDGTAEEITRQLLAMHPIVFSQPPAGTPTCGGCGEARWDVDSDITNRALVQVNDERPTVFVDRAGPEDSTKFDDDANVHCSACGADPGDEDKARIITAARKIVLDRPGRWEILNSYTDM